MPVYYAHIAVDGSKFFMVSQASIKTASENKGRLNVYLGDCKPRWLDYCKRLGKKPGAAIKEAIEGQLANDAKAKANPEKQNLMPRQLDEKPDTGKKSRLEVRLTPSEKSVIQTLAEKDNCSSQQWVVNALRGVLTQQAQFGMKEIEILGESNYQLLAIGRNLNQIAKWFNANDERAALTVKNIEALRGVIDRHTELVSKAMRANLERWVIK